MADEPETEDQRQDDRKQDDRTADGFPWWDLPDLLEMTVWAARGVWSLGALIVGVFRD